ncbi:helix-turn-helix domain-containing protein [Phenylobacterium montanum]|uniref:Helix-turn-helix domain-containing protein n=1 Tax=Phenylobacterium montanum TaxID=2823693 RepID=A0A975IUZ5_9CAUL|nr:helix-turn-helix transcriptional regulator [Caulobacter sp. S6]QUD88034.1 helix-turn-helix domain-containing protein [Caulobacter sp. S6]
MCQYVLMAQQRHYIREWRKHRGLTQEQLAERIGIARSYLTKIETGKRRYDQPFLEAAAEALRCGPGDLITRDPTDPEGIWSIWERIPPTERKRAVAVLKAMQLTGTDD